MTTPNTLHADLSDALNPELRDRAVAIARDYAKQFPQSYYAEPFEPHEWVVRAIGAALLEAAGREGFVLVPREPTKEMHAAFYDASNRDQRVFPGPSVIWKAMLAAAPSEASA